MKKLLLGCTGLVGLLFVGLTVFAMSLPDAYEITRVQPVEATPLEAYEVAADLHGWPDWTFWNREGDPEATWDFSGEPGTVGHTMKWKGETWGEGQIVFTECVPGERIGYELTFFENGEPMTSEGSIVFESQGTTTQVAWGMGGELEGIAGKLSGLLMDTIIGPMFEASLDGLAGRLEDAPDAGQ